MDTVLKALKNYIAPTTCRSLSTLFSEVNGKKGTQKQQKISLALKITPNDANRVAIYISLLRKGET